MLLDCLPTAQQAQPNNSDSTSKDSAADSTITGVLMVCTMLCLHEPGVVTHCVMCSTQVYYTPVFIEEHDFQADL